MPECSLFQNTQGVFFEKHEKTSFIERILEQFFMIFTRFGSEGGVFIFIGKKIN